MPVRRLLVVAVVPTLLAVAGCSGSSGPSQEQYAAAAEGVCKASGEKLDELYMAQAIAEMEAATGGESTTYVDRPERWVRAKIVPEYERLANSLKGIQRPDGDAAYLSDLLADLDRQIEQLQLEPSGGRATIEADEGLRDRFESYGIEGCPPPLDETPDHEDPVKVMEAAAEAAAPATEPAE